MFLVLIGAGLVAVVWRARPAGGNAPTTDRGVGTSATPEPTRPARSSAADPSNPTGDVPDAWQPPLPERLNELDAALASAVESLTAVIAQRPSDADPVGRLGVLYEAHDYRDLALRCYERAIAINSQEPRWHFHWAALKRNMGDVRSAEEGFRKVLSLLPDHGASHERLGLLLLERGATDDAAAHFRQVIELRPDQAPGYAGLARVKLAQRQPEEAISLLEQALQRAPDWSAAHYLLGQAYNAVGDRERAKVQFARGTDSSWLYVSNPWLEAVARSAVGRGAAMRYAQAMFDAGRTDSAIRIYEKLIDRNPADVEVINRLARLYLIQNRLNDAHRVLTKALKVDSDEAATHANMAALYYHTGNLGASLQHAEKAAALDPELPDAHYGIGVASAGMGDTLRARTALGKAVEFNAADPRFQQALCELLAYRGEWTEAEDPCAAAVRLEPENVRVRVELGRVLLRLGRYDDAAEHLRTALTVNPQNRRAERLLKRATAALAGE